MPTYDYICKKCRNTQEIMLPMAKREEPEAEPCPECGETDCVTQYLPSAAGLHSGRGMHRHDGGFNDILKKIQAGSGRDNTLDSTIW